MFKPIRGTSLILIVALLLLPLGCSKVGYKPPVIPPECEGAFVYQVPGFIPFGPMVIRAGTAAAMTLRPEIKPLVGYSAKIAYEVVNAGGVAGAINAMVQVIEPLKSYAPAVSVAAITLEELLRNAGQETQLTPCDKNILMSLFVNIGLDAGVDVRDMAPLKPQVLQLLLQER